jgi:hypothetical protein
MGEVPSFSERLMLEPVTVTRSNADFSWADTNCGARAMPPKAMAKPRLSFVGFNISWMSPNGDQWVFIGKHLGLLRNGFVTQRHKAKGGSFTKCLRGGNWILCVNSQFWRLICGLPQQAKTAAK